MSWLESAWPVSGSGKGLIVSDATTCGAPHVRPRSGEREVSSRLTKVPSSRISNRAKTANSDPSRRTRTCPDRSSPLGGAASTTTGADQLEAESVVRANSRVPSSGSGSAGSRSNQAAYAWPDRRGSAVTTMRSVRVLVAEIAVVRVQCFPPSRERLETFAATGGSVASAMAAPVK